MVDRGFGQAVLFLQGIKLDCFLYKTKYIGWYLAKKLINFFDNGFMKKNVNGVVCANSS